MSDVSGFTRGSDESDKYALSGKIMLSAIVILFTVVILIICLHIYARWFLARSHRRQQQLRNNRSRRGNRAHIIFTTNITTPSSTQISNGLEPSLLKSLPTFIFTSKKSIDTQKEEDEQTLECAVCLSEFQENEMGRLLPKCNHSFHIGCIDMWFHSHSTCPLCRSPVEPIHHDSNNNKIEIIIDSAQQQQPPPNLGTSSGVLCSSCEMGSSSSSSCSTSSSNSNDNTSFGSRRKVGVSIEVPRRSENLKSLEEEIQGSPILQAFKSPGGRILSFRRMLSREKRPSTPTSNCSFPDLERGEIEEQLQQIVHQSSNHQHQQQQGERTSRTESVA